MTQQIAMCSEVGPRDQLEDSVFGFTVHGSLPLGRTCSGLGVFDGVGGEFGGDVASNLALQVLRSTLAPILTAAAACDADRASAPDVVMAAVCDAFVRANNGIIVRRSEDANLAKMATTAVAGVVIAQLLYLAWAGDSRCYRWHGGEIECLTADHTELEPYIQAGVLTREEAKLHPSAHVITNYLGKPDIVPETRLIKLSPGDVLILCTDGVTDVLDAEDFAEELALVKQGRASFADAAKHLVSRALRAGTQDNATCLCCLIQDSETPAGRITRTITHGYRLTPFGQSRNPLTKGVFS